MELGSSTLAAWVNAVGQIVTTCIVAGIAIMTYRFTRRQSRILLLQSLNDMINEFNKVIISSSAAQQKATELRSPVLGQPADSLIFMYLNYLHTAYLMERDGLVPKDRLEASMRNGVHYFVTISRVQMEQLLSRGYDEDFKATVMRMYDSLVR